MSTLANILLYTFIGSIVSLIGGVILLSREKLAVKIAHFLSSFAAGVLLGTAFFDLLPEAAHDTEEKGIDIFLWTLVGIIIFFFLERFIHWFHHHDDFHEHEKDTKSTLPLIIISDTVHNFLDGIVIAATFMANPTLGLVTTLAVAAHEIPQEIGDFGLMLHKGMSKGKVLWVNVFSACAAFAGALITYFLGNILEGYIPIFLAMTAGFFIYIASSDLIPEIHHEKRKGFALVESLLLLLGIVVLWLAVTFLAEG